MNSAKSLSALLSTRAACGSRLKRPPMRGSPRKASTLKCAQRSKNARRRSARPTTRPSTNSSNAPRRSKASRNLNRCATRSTSRFTNASSATTIAVPTSRDVGTAIVVALEAFVNLLVERVAHRFKFLDAFDLRGAFDEFVDGRVVGLALLRLAFFDRCAHLSVEAFLGDPRIGGRFSLLPHAARVDKSALSDFALFIEGEIHEVRVILASRH